MTNEKYNAPVSLEVVEESIYDHPKYYDLVFGADCAAEIQFILGCGDLFMDRAPKRFFEPACGTGRLIHALAKRGYEVAGLDLNEKAIEFCNATQATRLRCLYLCGQHGRLYSQEKL